MKGIPCCGDPGSGMTTGGPCQGCAMPRSESQWGRCTTLRDPGNENRPSRGENGPLFEAAADTNHPHAILPAPSWGGADCDLGEFIYRVKDGRQQPMDALVSAQSVAAESLELGHEIGSLKAGYQADIIAVEGDPLENIEAVRNVVFVMKGGKIFKTELGFRSH